MVSKKSIIPGILWILLILTSFVISPVIGESAVKIWEEPLVIPTYLVDNADPNPIFYDGRAYQGAEGRVYPYPMLDRLTQNRVEKTYKAVYLENEYIQVIVLPEIGGRVLSAFDKTNNYDFIYRQHVIKPGLIGMLGAWISGGIEWNIPHHHRASTFMPIDYLLEENPDGSKTVWVGEIELRHRMKWMVGITLYPGKSYFEATYRISNRTPLVNSLLCFANLAVHARTKEVQVIFPPSTEWVTYHSKNDFASWPIARQVYRGNDYTKGVDISWWKNQITSNSFFAWNYEEDFFGSYDHKEKAGIAYFSNHNIAPGKKFWEWGSGSRGQAREAGLTETDGPYLELMSGAYSDNQPDYSWIQPYEVKFVKMYWYPIRDIGSFKNANLEAAVNLEVSKENTAKIGFNATSQYKNAKVLLTDGNKTIFEKKIDIGPDKPFMKEISLPSGVKEENLRVSLFSSANEELISYKPVKKKGTPMPDVVTPPLPPEDIKTVEELYLTGLRIDQFHNPVLEPYPYYEEALRRDPENSRVNVALGILYLKGGKFKEAAERFRIAIKRVTKDYTMPRDGEAFYYLGLLLKLDGKYEAAYDTLYKATWSHAFNSAAYYNLAEIDCIRGDFSTALEHINRSISTNEWNINALALKAAVLRHQGRLKEAEGLALDALDMDPLDFWAEYELYLVKSALGLKKEAEEVINSLMSKRELKFESWFGAEDYYGSQDYLEGSLAYANSGLWDDAISVLNKLLGPYAKEDNTYPMVYYFLGYFYEKKGDIKNASENYQLGNKMPVRYCFPLRLESIYILQAALNNNPKDARAHCYLGNLLFNHQPENAIKEWEKSRELDDKIAIVHRNLGIAYYKVENNISKAMNAMEKLIDCVDKDPRRFYELDVLYEAGGASPEKRLEVLQKNHEIIVGHNDAFSREIVLLTLLGHYDEAIEFMETHHFRRWEGLGNIHSTYIDAHILRGKKFLESKKYNDAIKDFELALEYPENLEVGRPSREAETRDCEVYYFLGLAYENSGNVEKAREFYEKSATMELGRRLSELNYYQGMALKKLDQTDKANQIFDNLIKYARNELESTGELEFFAKFGTQRSKEQRMSDSYYLLGLGFLGKGEQKEAKKQFEESLKWNISNLWAKIKLFDLS